MDSADFRRGLMHPEQKKVLTLAQMLGLYAWHGRHHVAHITSLRKREGWRCGRHPACHSDPSNSTVATVKQNTMNPRRATWLLVAAGAALAASRLVERGK